MVRLCALRPGTCHSCNDLRHHLEIVKLYRGMIWGSDPVRTTENHKAMGI